MGNWDNITGGNGEKDTGAVGGFMGQLETHETPSQQTTELEEKGQRRAVAIYNWLHLRSVLSPRLERVLDFSGTSTAQERPVAEACVKYNMENNNSQASLLLGAVLGAQSSAGSRLLEGPEQPLSKVP